ncbi:MAG TPA: hypothetical protein VFT75_18515 [Nocardioidaceae bacterium]|nr:hypothetical protein [Nocardioidaceae bacterium]
MGTPTNLDKRAIGLPTNDDRIEQIVRKLRTVVTDELGFELTPSRGDGELQLVAGNVRITYETRCTHGEGRAILRIFKASAKPSNGVPPARQREIRFTGSISVHDELEACRKQLLNIVRRASAVKP